MCRWSSFKQSVVVGSVKSGRPWLIRRLVGVRVRPPFLAVAISVFEDCGQDLAKHTTCLALAGCPPDPQQKAVHTSFGSIRLQSRTVYDWSRID
jgi:hypothetical protein